MSILSLKQNYVPWQAWIVRRRQDLPLVRLQEDGPDGEDLSREEADQNWGVAVALACWPLCLGATAVWAVL
ncbi:hypothetical protein J2858_002060 [Neorhizobium galegae]|uniref:hypothetical protein n=1 Tax=Rhizobium/Agrobacterium group TaxID=227290 RepID=UPI001AE13CF1|nr:hypothetical protein [Neorhizobium galegae]MBP2549144.1 hypothetical protein [Neorhizobium galegae]